MLRRVARILTLAALAQDDRKAVVILLARSAPFVILLARSAPFVILLARSAPFVILLARSAGQDPCR